MPMRPMLTALHSFPMWNRAVPGEPAINLMWIPERNARLSPAPAYRPCSKRAFNGKIKRFWVGLAQLSSASLSEPGSPLPVLGLNNAGVTNKQSLGAVLSHSKDRKLQTDHC